MNTIGFQNKIPQDYILLEEYKGIGKYINKCNLMPEFAKVHLCKFRAWFV